MDKQPLFNAEEIYKWVEHQASMGARRPGSKADTENENFIENSLLEFGLENVRKEPISITHWAAQDSHLEVLHDGNSQVVESFPIPGTPSPPAVPFSLHSRASHSVL